MSLIFGVVPRREEAVPEQWLALAEAATGDWVAEGTQRVSRSRGAFLCRQRQTTPWMRHSPPIVSDEAATVLFDGRLDNRTELAAAIGLRAPEGQSDAQIVHAAWRTLRDRLPQHLLGDFAIAIHEHATGELALIRDHLGVRPLFVAETDEFVAFASAMPPLLALPMCDRQCNAQWVVDYLEEVKPDWEYTAYRGIAAVPPAHLVRYAPAATSRRRYWSLPTVRKSAGIGRGEAIARTQELLESAIACRLVSGGGRIACELSGGLDFGSVAAIAADQLAGRGENLIGVTQATAEDFHLRYRMLTDIHFADAVYADRPQIERLDVVNETDSLLGRLSETLQRHGAPPRNDFNGIATEAPDLLAARDARVLLSGFGGDQLLTAGGASLAESMVAEGEWREVARLLMRKGARKRTVAALLSQVPGLRALVPPPRPLQRPSPHLASAAGRSAAGYPERAALHPTPPWHGTLQRRDEDHFSRPVMSYRLQDSQVGAGARGIEYRFPLLDIRLLEFVHALPAARRMHSGDHRRLIRDVMAGRLPEEVRQRRDKFGMTVPGVFVNVVRHAGELRAHIAAMAADPVLGEYARYDDVLRALDATLRAGEFPKESSFKAGEKRYSGTTQGQVLRLAMLGLWFGRDEVVAPRVAEF